MSILYGKVRLYGGTGQTITITDRKGNIKTINPVAGQEYTDIMLPGMEEYTIDDGVKSINVILDVGGIKEVKMASSLESLSWENIRDAIANGTIRSIAGIGATKSFIYNGQTMHAQLIHIGNNDTDKSMQYYPFGTADFITTECINDTFGSPYNGLVYNTLNTTVYEALPSDLKDVIIDKLHVYEEGYWTYSTSKKNWSWTSRYTSSSYKLWLPTTYEIGLSYPSGSPSETSYSIPYSYFIDNSSRIKKILGTNCDWWTVTPYSESSTTRTGHTGEYYTIAPTGGMGLKASYTQAGCPLCFRIGL